MSQSLFGLGAAIGGVPAQLQQRKQKQEETGMLAGLVAGSVEYNQALAQIAQQRGELEKAAQFGSIAREQELREQQQASLLQSQTATANLLMNDLTQMMNNSKLSEGQRTKARNLLKVAAVQGERASVLSPQIDALKKEIEGDRLSLLEAANLSKNWKPESVEKYQRTRNVNDLRINEPEEKEEVTEFTRLVRLAGWEDDSEQSQQLHKARAESLSKFNVQTLGPVAQLAELRDAINKTPSAKESQKSISQAQKAIATLNSVKQRMAKGEPVSEQVRVIERTVSELYNSDSRAASEIDRFLRGKGIKRASIDWVSGVLTGETSTETLNLYQEMAETVEGFSKNQLKNLASPFIEMFDADKEVVNKLNQIYYISEPSRTSTTQTPESPEISPDVINKYLKEAGA
tara:strand:- start:3504 stop:4712 length:1209 start_codon:yes stop_codon:yes gene_type:complete